MFREGDPTVVPLPLDRFRLPARGSRAGRAGRPGPSPAPASGPDDAPATTELLAEIARLRRRVDQQDHALARLSDALAAMRRGNSALRAENRELLAHIEAARLGGR